MEPCEQIEERSFGDLLRRYRVASGLTQERLSERSGMSVRGISDLERGLRLAPRRETVRLLAQALDLSSADWTALLLASGHAANGRAHVRLPAQRSGAPPLPASVDPFVGRSAEIAGIIDLLRLPDVRLVTIVGPGGVGKTRLALEVARHAPVDLASGPVFIPLASVTNPGSVSTAIAQALGVQPVTDTGLVERLTAALEGSRLLVLDNFEHVLSSAPILVDLLERRADLKILVTSRAPLSISGERRFLLAPMPVPASAGRQSQPEADDISTVDSVRLFVDRAKSAHSSFALTDENTDAVAGICRHLEGLPLAIELAAARVPVLDPRSLLTLLSPRLPRLTTGGRDQPPRLQTMSQAIAWSYDLLTAEQRACFCRLSVFEGGFSLINASAVANADGSGSDALDQIASLVDHSLIQSLPQPDGPNRFSMLEMIREFGLEQLTASDDYAITKERHATVYLSLAEEARPLFEGPAGNEALGQLELEHSNLLAALNWLIGQGDSERALRLGGALWKFWLIHGHLRQGGEFLERALGLPGDRTSAHRTEALYGAGVLARETGRRHEAAHFGEELRVLSGELCDVVHQAMAYFLMGTLAAHDRNLLLAGEQYQHALELFREVHNDHAIAMMLHQLANVTRELGAYDAADAQYAEALAIWRQREDLWGSALALHGLAVTAENQAKNDHAFKLYTAALDLHGQLGAIVNVARGLEGIARLAAKNQQPELAVQLFSAAGAMRASIGSLPDAPGEAGNNQAMLLAREQLDEDAIEASWTRGQCLGLQQAIAVAETEYRAKARPRPLIFHESPLTRRETEVLKLVATGQTDREIGEVLFISRRTVTSHMSSILNKLGVTSRTAAAATAVRSGLV
jgi:predicted ATPase/DNA-binding CsgD family transcriptional regulator/transcriptional regulator with XRE-family HTH domain